MKRLTLPIAVLLACVPGAAWAVKRCTVSVTPLSFGLSVNPLGATLTPTATVTVACSGGGRLTSYTMAMSTGSSGNFSQRYMTSGTNQLNYNLYTASNLVTVWGDGTGVSQTVSGSDERVTKTYTAYGQLPLPQSGVVPGAYSDTITVTLTY